MKTRNKRKGFRIIAMGMAMLLTTSGLFGIWGGGKYSYVQAEEATPIASVDGPIDMYDTAVTFDPASSWDDKGVKTISGITTDGALREGAKLTMDVLLPVDANYTGVIKFQGAVKLGDAWAWTEFPSIPELAITDFTVEGSYKKATVIYTGDPLTTDKIMEFDVKAAGYQCNYNGTIQLGNIRLYNGAEAVTEELVASVNGPIDMYDTAVTFDPASSWDDKGVKAISGITTDGALREGAKLTMDVLLPVDANYTGVIKFQGAVKLGDAWAWTEFPSIPELAITDFTVEGSYKKATVIYTGDPLTTDKIMEFDIKAAGYQCNYNGTIQLANIKLYNVTSGGSGGSTLPEREPSVIDDFEDGTDGGWVPETGWQYDGDVGITAVEWGGQKVLKLDLDYTGKEGVSWSEAKIKKDFAPSYDISAYNYLTVEVYYPGELDVSKLGMKFFADGVLNKDVSIEESETLSNGWKKGIAAVKFSPTTTPLENLTLGIVGKNTNFVGSVYIDNIVLSQYNAAGDYVTITSVPDATGTQANLTGMPANVKLADGSATAETRRLYSYLTALSNNDQVLFGHENDYNKKVSQTASEGDVKELTGSLSGIYGIDTLSISGAELGLTDPAVAMDTAVANSLAAANQGSIITLSAHMPNFTNDKITLNADGTYNFTACDFTESKDLSNNCAEQILPGGEYNAQFNAYLDMIAEYALRLQAENVPILFRPFHENNGGWFWWGSTTSVETYKSIYRYTEEYLGEKGVHNMLYVYSPNGPFTSESKYLERYPGDEYVDILAFDYYDDYNTYPATSDGNFYNSLKTTCQVVSGIAVQKGKIAAISETGVRVMKKDGSDNEGLLVTGNPVAQSKTGKNWYQEVSKIADETGMPYYLVWANFGDTNFYVPYKYNDTMGQEMANEFIDFYNSDTSIFANGTNFYNNSSSVTVTSYTNAYGYMIAPFDRAVIKDAMVLRGSVKNGTDVKFVITNPDTGKTLTLPGVKQSVVRTATAIANQYTAELSKAQLEELGKTDSATIELKSGDTSISILRNVSLGKDKDKAPENVIDDFDYYVGSESLLQSTYTENSAGGCSSEFLLESENKSDGSYGGAFHYVLETTGSEVWTGQIKSLENHDFSAYNAIEMWVKPDGKSQKLVVQLTDESGEEFEVYLTNFVKGTEAQYVIIPFSSFVGKQGGTLNTAKLTKFAIWCNSIVPENHTGTWRVDSTIYFDGIQGVDVPEETLRQVNADGLIFSNTSFAKKEDTITDSSEKNTSSTDSPKTGDEMPLYLMVAIMALTGAFGVFSLKRKK